MVMLGKSSKLSAPSNSAGAARRVYVLDTNVLMHDPAALFRFDEHDIFLPMVVLEELDHNKKGLSEPARNARQVSRFLDEIMQGADKTQIDQGLTIPTALPLHGDSKRAPSGKIYFQTRALPGKLPAELPGQLADNAILAQTLALQAESPRARVTLVSKDINLRIKAAIVGIHAEDYYSDRSIDDADVLDTGSRAVAEDFWQRQSQNIRSGKDGNRTWYELQGSDVSDWHLNQFIYEDREQGIEAIVRQLNGDQARLELLQDFRTAKNSVWGITARNREQNFALNLLLDPAIDLVTILGPAGTGKTLLTLAAGLMQTLDSRRGHRLLTRHRRRKNGTLDGRTDG
jgi:PhoH-like ATPase